MTTTAEPLVAIEVGTIITSREQLTALPVGAVIRYDGVSTQHYTKLDTDSWQIRGNEGMAWADHHFTLGGANVVESLPGPVLSVGDRITTREQLEALPLGAIVQTRTGRTTYTREERGLVSTPGGRVRDFSPVRSGSHFLIVHLPGSPAEPEEIGDTTEVTPIGGSETLEQYKQRFRTIVYGSAYQSGVSTVPLDRAMEKLSVVLHNHTPGMHVAYSDSSLMNSMPRGATLEIGRDPSDFNGYAVYGKDQNGGFIRLVGGAGIDEAATLRLLSIPDVEPAEWATAEAGLEDREAIRAFMRQAWQLGLKAKSENQWCGEYEAAMSRAGINEAVGSDTEPGLSAEEVAALPEGTYVRFAADASASVIYKRDDRADNPAKTRRVAGSLPGAWIENGMVKLWSPDDRTGLRFSVHSAEEMDAMPLGTVVTDRSSRWTKREPNPEDTTRAWYADGDNRYGYRSRQFTVSSLTYVVIP